MAFSIGDLVAKLKLDADDFERTMDDAIGKLQLLEQTTGRAGRALSLGLTAPLVGLATVSVHAAAGLERMTNSMTSVMGSAKGAEAEIAKLKRISRLPGLNFKDAVQGSIRLQAAGASAEMARQSLEGFGNAIATVGGSGAELESVSRALGQILSSGQVMGREIQMLQRSVPQVRQAMVEAFGTGRAEDIQKLNISAEEFIDRLNEVLLKMPKVAGGTADAFTEMRDAAGQASAALGKSLLPMVTDLLKSLTKLADFVSGLNQGFLKWAVAIGVVLAAVGPLLTAFTTLSKIFIALKAALALGLLPALASPVGLAAALALAAGGLVRFMLRSKEAEDAVEDLADAVEDLPDKIEGRILNLNTYADAVVATFNRMKAGMQAIREAEPIKAVAPVGQLRATADALERLNELHADLKEKIADLEFELHWEKNAEAAKKLNEELEKTKDVLRDVERELNRVASSRLAQLVWGAGGEGGLNRLNYGPEFRIGAISSATAGTMSRQGMAAMDAHYKKLRKAAEGARNGLDDVSDGARILSPILGRWGATMNNIISGISQGGWQGIGNAAVSLWGTLFSELFGGNDEPRIEALKENTRAILMNTAEMKYLRGQLTGRQMKQLDELIEKIDWNLANNGGFRFPAGDDWLIEKLGLTVPSDGDWRAWKQIADLLRSRLTFGGRDLADAKASIFDIEDPLELFNLKKGAFASGLPSIPLFSGGSTLGLQIQKMTLEEFDAWAKSVFEQIAAGTFDWSLIGDMTAQDFLDWIMEVESLGDAAQEAADELNGVAEALRNVPQGYKVPLARFGATTPYDVLPNGTSYEIASMTVVANDPEMLWKGIEEGARTASARGGTDSVFLTTRPKIKGPA